MFSWKMDRTSENGILDIGVKGLLFNIIHIIKCHYYNLKNHKQNMIKAMLYYGVLCCFSDHLFKQRICIVGILSVIVTLNAKMICLENNICFDVLSTFCDTTWGPVNKICIFETLICVQILLSCLMLYGSFFRQEQNVN